MTNPYSPPTVDVAAVEPIPEVPTAILKKIKGASLKHAGPAALADLAPLLERLRTLTALIERTPGTFYLRSSAFLHFHEDRLGLFADVKLNGKAFERFSVTTEADRHALFKLVASAVAQNASR
jgi:hypothetical protein